MEGIKITKKQLEVLKTLGIEIPREVEEKIPVKKTGIQLTLSRIPRGSEIGSLLRKINRELKEGGSKFGVTLHRRSWEDLQKYNLLII